MMKLINWESVLSKPIARKSVALHPIEDAYVRKTWAILIEAGYDASYSSTLNLMILTAVMLVANQRIDKKTEEIMRGFLKDKKTIRTINLEDLLIRFNETFKKIMKSR